MWAKQFSVDLKWLKKILIGASIFAVLVVTVLLGLRWDRIIYPGSFVEKEKSVIIPNLTASTTLSQADKVTIKNIMNLLESKSLEVTDIHVDEWRDVYVGTDLSRIIFSLKSDNQNVVNTLMTIIDNKIFQDSPTKTENMLEYIDIRFGNKVFYKYKDGKQLATTTKQDNFLEQGTTTSR